MLSADYISMSIGDPKNTPTLTLRPHNTGLTYLNAMEWRLLHQKSLLRLALLGTIRSMNTQERDTAWMRCKRNPPAGSFLLAKETIHLSIHDFVRYIRKDLDVV